MLYLSKVISDIANPVILDYTVKRYNSWELIDDLNSYKPKIVGFTFTAASYLSFKQILKDVSCVKKRNGILTVAGGVHASSLPDYLFKDNPDLDFIISGEGEIPFRNFVNSTSNNFHKIENLFCRDNGIYKGNEFLLRDIEELGWPDRTLINSNRYRLYNNLRRVGSIISSRGCPYKCSYCYHSKEDNRVVRYRSVASLIEEIAEAKNKSGIHQFHFNDDFFTLNINRVKSFCNELLEKTMKISWSCQGRADHGDYEMFKLMKDSGCREVTMGIETISEENMEYIEKKISRKSILTTVRTAQRAGLNVRGNFIIGFPDDTNSSIVENINFAKSLKLARTGFYLLTPYPHSKIWDEALKRNLIDLEHIDWNRFSQFSPFFTYKVEPDKLLRYRNWGNHFTSHNFKQKLYYFLLSEDKIKYIKDCSAYLLVK